MTRKFRINKFGLAEDPRGQHVTLYHNGRELLGEVQDCHYDPVTGCVQLTVNHFDGEPWPVKPTALAVNVLIRE